MINFKEETLKLDKIVKQHETNFNYCGNLSGSWAPKIGGSKKRTTVCLGATTAAALFSSNQKSTDQYKIGQRMLIHCPDDTHCGDHYFDEHCIKGYGIVFFLTMALNIPFKLINTFIN